MEQMWTRSDNNVLATLQDVVALQSVNPDLPGGDHGECLMVDFISRFFKEIELPCQEYEVLPGRNNIVASLEGQDPSRVLLFECHMDTASVGVMTIPPFEPHIREGLLYGRGSCDTKAGGIAMIHAMKRIKETGQKPPCTIQFAGAVDEEYLFRGALDLAANLKTEAVVVAEPTDLSVIRAHKGVARFRIHVEGIAAHSSKPYLGVNAIVKMAQLITDIEREVPPTFQEKDHPLTGGPTLNIGVINGGAQVNFVPDSCIIEIDRRVIPGEIAEQTLSIFEQILSRAQTKDPDLKVKLEDPFLLDGAMETPEDSRIVQVASDASRTVIGNATITGVPYGTDASKFTAVGIPAIVLGPGSIDQAHGAVEWVECSQVLQAVDIYQAIMMNFH